jgi:hypothetical protein
MFSWVFRQGVAAEEVNVPVKETMRPMMVGIVILSVPEKLARRAMRSGWSK